MKQSPFRLRFTVAAAVAICLLTALPLPASATPAQAGGSGGPRLLRVSPGGGEGLGRDTTILLSFDRPMDRESLARAAYFEPPLPFSVSGEAECLFVPDNLLSPNAAYSFHLKPGLAEDFEGRTFDEDVLVSFTTRGDGVTIEIPAFSFVGEVIEGKDPQGVASVISFGVGHYPGTGRPGAGNYVIMAHASGQVDFPFNALFDLVPGDTFRLTYGGRDYVYGLCESRVVEHTEMWIIDPTPYPQLTAFVCSAADGRPSPTFHPSYRFVVRAALVGASPHH